MVQSTFFTVVLKLYSKTPDTQTRNTQNLTRKSRTTRKFPGADSNRTTNPEGIQLLSPIRHFALENLPKREDLVAELFGIYTQFLNANWDYNEGRLHKTVPQELLNLHSVLHDAIKAEKRDTALIRASICFTRWSLYIGNSVEDIIRQATDSKAELRVDIPEVFLNRAKLDEAEESLNQVVELHRQAQDVLGEATDLQNLGDVCLRRSKLDEAEESLNQAVELHRQAQNVLGEAYDLQRLEQVYLRREQLEGFGQTWMEGDRMYGYYGSLRIWISFFDKWRTLQKLKQH
ncbi:hypothetical protein K435DRAFT_798374 [Dendrothele bispora CBS 962.96]|uniref:Uncharacterized protein n=1 Tax=Dendrothele bispora (strain CBS 962.96) TaxID=1314807 RepID=A0A4V4HFJ9_DENBC|nr:hypothetical protein K435DRAFT_798374 [Dendrothele bispora CBS 962.96]